jgi:signal peptidase I
MKEVHMRLWRFSTASTKGRALYLVLLALLAGSIRTWVMTPLILKGASMLPTCYDGQIAILDKLTYRWRSLQRGDLVCVWTGRELFDKRIVGLPGEEVAIRNGVIFTNGQPLAEPYVTMRGDWNVDPGKLGPKHYLVVGDNRSLAQQQAVLAVVRRDRIVGRLVRFF